MGLAEHARVYVAESILLRKQAALHTARRLADTSLL